MPETGHSRKSNDNTQNSVALRFSLDHDGKMTTQLRHRTTFHHINRVATITPTERDLRWLKLIERHGPLASTHLLNWTADTHRCRDSGLRRLQALRAAKFLYLPRQQRQTERAEFKPYVYDLAPLGRLYLQDSGVAEDAIRPTGHWWHLHETAMLTARVELECRQRGLGYIPAHEILGRSDATLAIAIGCRRLIPDQLFAIDYGGLFRAFMVEVDRGTEPIASSSARKSWSASLALYSEGFRSGAINRHYGLNAPIQVIWSHKTTARQGAFERLLEARDNGATPRHLSCRGQTPPEVFAT